jgi:hypothetical protein
MIDLDMHPFRVEYGRGAVMHFTNIRAAVLTAIEHTGTRDGFRVLDARTRRYLTFDEVREIENAPAKRYWRQGEVLR